MTPGARLGWQEIDEIRRCPGRSTLLFITDRCPVGCAHCSVDSRRDSPTITDHRLFEDIVDWVCAEDRFELVGVSGGEPFVERRGLSLASERIVAAGKRLVVYTSGVWATRATPPTWIAQVLERCTTVFLSTDSFHAAALDEDRFVNAARAISAAGAWIVTQVIDEGDMVARARGLLRRALGDDFEARAEVHPTYLLPAGRGADVFISANHWPGQSFPRCRMLGSPMVRYDGVVTACCNESVIMGQGPARLRRQCRSGTEVGQVVEAMRADPWLEAIGGAGPGALTMLPRNTDLRRRSFASVCDLCWKILDRAASDPPGDPLIAAFNAVDAANAVHSQPALLGNTA